MIRREADSVLTAGSPLGLGLARKRADDVTAQWSAGEMRSALLLARAGHDRMVELANDLDFSPSLELTDEILVLKTHVVESARTAVEKALETAGGPGFYRRAGLERLPAGE